MNNEIKKRFLGKTEYESRCWHCVTRITSSRDVKCPFCNWFICSECYSCSPNCEYGKAGFNEAGMSRNGTKYNEYGYDRNGYNAEGFDKNGFNARGLDRDGFGRSGYNVYGFDKTGMNREGYDIDGYNSEGFNKSGYDRMGFNVCGFDINGVDRNGNKPYVGKKIYYKGFKMIGKIISCSYDTGTVMATIEMEDGRLFQNMNISDCLKKGIVTYVD